jgi:phage terminase large subunit-like protein
LEKSLATKFAEQPDSVRREVIEKLDPEKLLALRHDWHYWARPSQLAPKPGEPCVTDGCNCHGNWRYWVLLAGRGYGKTKAGAEWVNEMVRDGIYKRFHLVGATASDVRDIMVEGPSGVVTVSHPDFPASYHPTKRKVTWPNGAQALCFSADEPERLRGEQCEAAWVDEICSWRYPQAWTQLMLGLRLGHNPRVVVTTTPKPTKLIKDLVKNPATHLTKGSTYDNIHNLASAFTDEITRAYEGTRFGRQELYAEILEDSPGALWQFSVIDENRVDAENLPPFKRVVIGVDPAVSFGEDSDETGIVVAALGTDNHAYVLDDLSGRYRVEDWSRKVVVAYYKHMADRVVAERNNGGDMVENTLRVVEPNLSYRDVHATRSKQLRAEPVAAAYEQGRVHHVGVFDKLEEQQVTWEPGMSSPDRIDAAVYALTDLIIRNQGAIFLQVADDDELFSSRSEWRI